MAIWKFLAAAAASFAFLSAPAASQPRDRLLSYWMVEPAPPPQGVRHLASKELVLEQRLLPTGLAELARSTTTGEIDAALLEGTQLIEVKSSTGAVYCEGELDARGLGGRGQQCFLDGDRDGAFETWFKVLSATPGFVTISGKLPKKLKPLAQPLAYRLLEPTQSRLGAFVGIERRNWFNIYSRESFMIVFGSGEEKERITHPVQFKSADMPKELNVLGARFTALSESDGKMAIRVDAGMPAQPFAVVQTTTYRVY